jgi:hypothetical protein
MSKFINMDSQNTISKTFQIEFRENSYACDLIEQGGMDLYRIRFNQSPLYLTKAVGANGKPFWTSIPADPKLNHIVLELGQKIDNYFK